jgi:hypothetical protein
MDVNEAVDRYLQGQTLNLDVQDALNRGSDQNGREFFLLYSTLQRARNLKSVPEMLKRIIKQNTWKKWTWVGRTFEAQTLAEYLTRPIPQGLGANLDFIEKVISDDVEALAMFREGTTREPHQHKNGDTDNVSIKPKHGNAKAYLLDRLKRERPDLFIEVREGRLSVHKAAKIAGWVKKPEPLKELRKWWTRASKEERETFLAELK